MAEALARAPEDVRDALRGLSDEQLEVVKAQAVVALEEPAPARREWESRAHLERERDEDARHREWALDGLGRIRSDWMP